ncbi:MAG: hypothetical protein C7B43_03360 [Sulfobacillus benefaciens]|uniref:ABC transporter substrate-binding protein n=1 Tax=Sulfobacillus benefaciens TaxID=453960 RepID=A0A2T2X9M1_9FIRM|nr:MAG: hypothetical protein C7B43_03360 [Sulfobacillus benefaciens]
MHLHQFSRFKSNRLMLTAAATTAAALTLAGCGSTQAQGVKSSSGVETVTLWESHPSQTPAGKTMSALVNKFNSTHHSIHVDLVVTKASHKALGALAAGDAPVLAEISHYDGNFLAAHALESWNPYMGHEISSSLKQSMYPAVWHNGEVNGQHYRLQADAKVSQLTYNKAIFAKVGISHVPTTWTQLAQDVALIKAKDPGVIPLAWKDSSAHILPPMLSNGGHIYKPGSNQKAADFLSSAARSTFSYFRTLYQNKEMIFAHGTQIRADLGSGKLAIADGTSAGYDKALAAVGGKFPVGVFPYPQGSTGHPSNLVQGLGFVLMKGHSSAQYKAAATLVNWFFSPSQQTYWGENSGDPPVTSAGYQQIPSSFLSSHPGLVVASKIMNSPYTISRPIPDSYKEVQASLDTQFFNIVTGRETLSKGLSTLEQQANGYLSGKSAL